MHVFLCMNIQILESSNKMMQNFNSLKNMNVPILNSVGSSEI